MNGNQLSKRSHDDILPLGKSPVNLALYFDLTRFKEGEHEIAFQLFLKIVEIFVYKKVIVDSMIGSKSYGGFFDEASGTRVAI